MITFNSEPERKVPLYEQVLSRGAANKSLKVVMLVKNCMTGDARVEKEAQVISDQGHQVTVIAVKCHGASQTECRGQFQIVRLGLQSRAPLKVINFIIRFPRRTLNFVRSTRSRLKSKILKGSRHLKKRASPLRLAIFRWAVTRNAIKDKQKGRVVSSRQTTLFQVWIRKVRTLLIHRTGIARSFDHWKTQSSCWDYYYSVVKTVRELDPDVIHVHDLNAAYGVVSLAAELNVPIIYDSHELWLHRNRGPRGRQPKWLERRERRIERLLVKKARNVITVCQSIGNHLQEQYGVESIEILRNVPVLFDDSENTSRIKRFRRDSLGIADTDMLLTYSGKATFNRGIEEVFSALKLLGDHFHFMLLGDVTAAYKRHLDHLIVELGIGGRVHFYGPVPSAEVASYLKAGDISLVPIVGNSCLSYHYCLPNKLFEAIMAGLPVLGSDLPEIRNCLEYYGCGEVIKDLTPKFLSQQILELAGDSDKMDRYRGNARLAAKELNWNVESQKLRSIYAGLTAEVKS